MKTIDYKPYYGQYDPNKKGYINQILDQQNQIFLDAEKKEDDKTIPKRAIILGTGVLVLVGVLVIYKYK